MADRADVLVKNLFSGNVKVNRLLPDDSIDLDVTVAGGSEELIHLPGPEVTLKMFAPEGVDINTHPFHFRSDVDLGISCSRTGAYWSIKIEPSDLLPETPTTVNVSLGEQEPE